MSCRLPPWLRRNIPKGGEHAKTDGLLKKLDLKLVCEEAKCPNRLECYSNKTATFLALGKECTRACGFCDIDFSKKPIPPDPTEPDRIAAASKVLGLKHIVVTMVSRDDLFDGGAAHIASIIRTLRKEMPASTIEVLTSDFGGNEEALQIVLNERPEVFNHNIETTRALTPRVRHKATYDRTLHVLKAAKESGLCRFTKSGLMVGLGESMDDVKGVLRDLHAAGCSAVTVGQYLQATKRRLNVKRFYMPEEFKEIEEYGLAIGIEKVYAGPFVRSSYNAHQLLS